MAQSKWLLIALFFSANLSFAQQDDIAEEDSIGNVEAYVGVMAGALFPNNKLAYVYNGLGDGGVNELLNTYPFIKQDMVQALGYDFYIPENQNSIMRYKIPVYLGLDFNIKTGNFGAILMEVNFADLKLLNYLEVQAIDPNSGLRNEPKQTIIEGKEQRFEFNLGYQKHFWNDYKTSAFYLEALANFNVSQGESFWYVDDYRVEVFSPTNNYNPSKTGFGYGGILGAGFIFNMQNDISLELGGRFIYNKIVITDTYEDFLPQGALFAKIFWHFGGEEEQYD